MLCVGSGSGNLAEYHGNTTGVTPWGLGITTDDIMDHMDRNHPRRPPVEVALAGQSPESVVSTVALAALIAPA